MVKHKIQIFSKKIPLLFIVAVFVFSTFGSLFSPVLENANAADSTTLADSKDLDWQIRSMVYYRSIGYCIGQSPPSSGTIWGVADEITKSDAAAGKWFMAAGVDFGKGTGPNTYIAQVGAYLRGDGIDDGDADVQINCGDMAPVITSALSMWGWKADEALCAFGYYRLGVSSNEQKPLCTSAQRGGNDKDWDAGIDGNKPATRLAAFKSAVAKKVYGGTIPDYSNSKYNSFWYKFYLKVFQQTCAKGKTPLASLKSQYDPNNGDSSVFKVAIVSDTGDVSDGGESYVLGVQKRNFGVKTRPESPDNANSVVKSCADIEGYLNNLATYYKAYAIQHPDKTADNDAASGNSDNGDPKTSCGVEGIGWIVCPIISFMGDLLENAFNGLANNFLQTDTSLFSTDSGTYTAWSVFRNFANVAFVIVFLIIIFSQLTGVGVSNYGVKKLLPRIVIAAILVNVSYFICQIAVDLSNILGYSLRGIFDGIATTANVPTSTDASANGFGITTIILAVIATATVAYFALSILIPILLGALIGVLMVVLMLIARKAIIVLLIVLSPLAFVAFLLPNTESLFTKWRKAFMALLLLFPIIAVVFGMSSLASQIVLQSTPPGDSTKIILQITAVGIASLPFFLVPVLLKGSLNGIGTVGGKLTSFANKAGGNLGKAGSKGFANSRLGQFQAYRGAERSKRRSLIQSGAYSGKGGKLNPRNWASNANKAFNDSAVSGKFGDRNAAAGLSLAEKAESEDIKAATMLMKTRATERGTEGMSYAKTELESALKSGDSIKARAAYSTLTSMGQAGVEQARTTLTDTKDATGSRFIDKNAGLSNALKQHIINNHPEMKTSDNRQMGWATNDENATLDGNKHLNSLTDAQIASQTADSINAGSIDPARARRILDDVTISPNIKDSQRKALEAKAAGAPSIKPPTGPGDSGGSPPPAGFTPQDNGFLVPHK